MAEFSPIDLDMTQISDPNKFLVSLFDAAVEAADPAKIISGFLPPAPKGRTIVIGGGKASSQMGKAFEDAWSKERGTPLEGVIVTRYGYATPCENFEVLEASHPVPDAAGLVGSKRLMEAVSGLTEDDLVVALISGGGSALLPAPPDGLTLEDEIAVNEALLASGAPISAMNTVRKAASTIKGGRLAVACHPAKLVSLLVSDIPGDHAHFIASGPTVADEGTRQDALAIIQQYEMQLPDAVMAHLKSDAANAPLPSDPELARAEHHIFASAAKSLERAQVSAIEAGIETHILSDAIEGEAREAARTQAAIAKEILHRDRPFKKPVLLLSGGPSYRAIAYQNLSPWSKRVTSMCSRLIRFEGGLINAGATAVPAGAGGLLLNAMDVTAEGEDEFNAWYDQEHIPALAGVPGTLAARRFKAADGRTSTHQYVAIYHLKSPDVTRTDAWREAVETPWTQRVRPHFKNRLRVLCGRYMRASGD